MTPFLFWGAVVLHHGPAPELDLQIDLTLDDSVAVERAFEPPEGLNDVDFDDEPRLDLDCQLEQMYAEMARGRGFDGQVEWQLPVKAPGHWRRWPAGLDERRPSHCALMDLIGRGIMPEPSAVFRLDSRV